MTFDEFIEFRNKKQKEVNALAEQIDDLFLEVTRKAREYLKEAEVDEKDIQRYTGLTYMYVPAVDGWDGNGYHFFPAGWRNENQWEDTWLPSSHLC